MVRSFELPEVGTLPFVNGPQNSMHVPIAPPRDPPLNDYQTWSDIARAYLMMVAIPVVLWFVSNPLVGGATVLGLISLRAAFHRARAGFEYVREQCCLVLRVGDRVQITLSRSPMKR